MRRSPLVPALLLRLLVPRSLHEAIAGDLEETWRTRPDRVQYWTDALRSIADCWRGRFQSNDDQSEQRRGDGAMTSLLQDVRYGLRMMRRNPGFTVAAAVTLALGIGANSAIFSILNILSLKPLPYHDPSRVVFLLGVDAETGGLRFSLQIADYLDIQRDAQSFERVASYSYLSANITGGDIPERVQAYRVTADTFEMLGVPAARGRTIGRADTVAGREHVAVISDGLWKRRFGADPGVVGRKVMLNGQTHEIVGVMPERFEFPVFNFKGDVWLPWTLDATAAAGDRRASGSTTVIARIRSGVPEAQADAELKTIMRRLAAEHPQSNRSLTARVVQMGRLDDEQAGSGMVIAMSMVALVLLLACANVANLLLARGVSRSRELAVRAAVGATRWRIARQLVVESVLLALIGAAGGVLLAKIAVDAIRRILPEMILTTVPNVSELGIDATTFAFTLVLAITASLVFGVLPAWRAARPQLQDGLKEGAAAGGTRGTRRLRTTLVVLEVALATLLVVSAGLLARSYSALSQLNPGFDSAGVLTMAMALPADRYPDGPRRLQFYERAQSRIRELPGVQSAAFVNVLPFSTYFRYTPVAIDGAPPPAPGREPRAAFRIATPEYFATLRIPLISGRVFDARDREGSDRVGIVNRTFVRQFMKEGDAIGRRVRIGSDTNAPWITIVGTIDDVHQSALTEDPEPELYLPHAQSPIAMMMLAVRTAGSPEDHIAAVRGRILDIDPQQPVYHVKPMARLVGDSRLSQSASASFMATFSALALVLAIIGVYGVISYGVNQQMPEFGVRLALGATPSALVKLVIRRGALMVVAGVVLGLAGAVAASGAFRALLYGVTPLDTLTYASAAALLLIMGLAACVLPAWRAASADALSALRAQ
jgi:predicted permease